MKIYLSPSNQPNNAYSGVKTTEKIEMEAVATKVKAILESNYIIDVVMANFSLGINKNERPAESKKYDCNFYLAIHSNAGGAGKASGTVCFYHPNSANAKVLAESLVKELNAICPVKSNRSSSVVNGMNAFNGAGYGEIRSPMQFGIPSALVEVNFHDNPTVARWIVDNKNEIANAIVKSIVTTFKIEKKHPTEPTSGTLYRVQTGAYKNKANADSQLAKVKAEGFDTYMVKVDGLYKIQVGAYSKKTNADAMLAKVKNAGFDAFITTKSGQAVSAEPSEPVKKTIQVGSTVRLKQGAKTYTGGGLASFVYKRNHKVKEINGDRVVITYDGIVIAAVKLTDLELV